MMINRTVWEALMAKREESQSTDQDGSRWSLVYLPNAQVKRVTPIQFAGALVALEQLGVYRPTGDKYFGEIKIK